MRNFAGGAGQQRVKHPEQPRDAALDARKADPSRARFLPFSGNFLPRGTRLESGASPRPRRDRFCFTRALLRPGALGTRSPAQPRSQGLLSGSGASLAALTSSPRLRTELPTREAPRLPSWVGIPALASQEQAASLPLYA